MAKPDRPGKGESRLCLPRDYTVVDTETTGLSTESCSLIEVSALRVRGGEVAEVIIATAYEADTRQVIDLIAQVAEQYGREHQDLIEEMPVVPGIDSLGESSVNIVVRCKVKSMKQWEVERGLRLAIKEEFDRRGVEFPYPRMMVGRLDETVHAAPPAPPKGGREEATIPMWASAEEEDG